MKPVRSLLFVTIVTCELLFGMSSVNAVTPTTPVAVPCSTTPPTAIQYNGFGQMVQSIAAPIGSVLPYDSDARLVLHQPLVEAGSAKTFRVFELHDPEGKKATASEVAVISAESVPQNLLQGYAPTDSVLLHIQLQNPDFVFWSRRYFVILACTGDHLSGWAVTSSRVSDPHVSLFVCTPVLLLVYLLSMAAVRLSRNKVNPLVIKYPATFGTKPMRVIDFLNPIHLTADAFNQASVQKSQVLLFSFLVGWLLLSLVVRTGALVDLSATVVGLLGISGVGAATAQITYQQKTRLSFENWAWLQTRGVLQPPASPRGPQWRDLVLTNREFDVYKLQTIIFSVTVAAALISSGATNLATFSVPSALLGILGLSQVVYVGGILVRPPAVSDLDDALTKLRLAGETVAAAKAQGTDTGPDGKLLNTLPPGQPIAANAQRQYNDLADTIIPMIESTLEIPADRSKL
jgi:hypothetical protein